MKLIQFKKILFFTLFTTVFNTVCLYDFDDACQKIGLSNKGKNLKVIGKKSTNRSHVIILKDRETGKKYIIKQLRKISTNPLHVVQEMLGTYVVNWLGILSQKVIIIPPNEFQKFKKLKDQPATLHTFIDEKPIKNIRRFKKLETRQIKLHSAAKDHGLTRGIIKSIALYGDLPSIIAADTFLGVDDRHRGNLLFSEKLQRFWLIDMDYTYHSALVEACIKQMQKLIKDGTRLPSKEKKALMRYKATLEKLRIKFTKDKLNELLHEFIEQAEIPEKKLKSRSGTSYSTVRSHIEKTTKNIQDLIYLLDKIITRS